MSAEMNRIKAGSSIATSFEVLSEAPLHTTEFGQGTLSDPNKPIRFHSSFFADAPINVGWGSKQTQFHGCAQILSKSNGDPA